MNVILFGDLDQLLACFRNPIYKQPAAFLAEQDLWRIFSAVKLTVNQRQAAEDS